MLRLVLGLAVILPAVAAQPATRSASPADDEQDVIAAAQSLFDAMLARDTTAALARLHPASVVVGVAPDGRVSTAPGPEWARGLALAPDGMRERIWAPRVEIDGALATLWARYDFHEGDRFSHCGTDAFQFVRDGAAWRLLVVTFTMEADGCEARAPSR